MTYNTGLSRGHSASRLPREAPWPRQGAERFRLRQTAHSSRTPGTAMPDEDCDFLQIAEVPPASSVGERSPRRESTFSISPPSPTRRPRVTIGDFSEPTSVTPGPRPSTKLRIASYLGSVDDPIIARSALKHGLSEADILHAYHHPIRAWDMGDGFTMLLGANRAALVLEIGYIQGITAIVIVHAMRAREKFLR